MDQVYSDSFTGSFWALSDIVFKWVPATLNEILNGVQTGTAPQTPVTIWDLPRLVAGGGGPSYESIVQGWTIFAFVMFSASVPFLAITVYSMIRVWQIRRAERAVVAATQARGEVHGHSKSKHRWDRISEQIATDDPDAWRLAILEADIMLNELLDVRGYKGETMADKMKQVDAADFNSINDAWEAHKYRNRIAHETAHNALEYREVRRIISLYERVFREFGFIEHS